MNSINKQISASNSKADQPKRLPLEIKVEPIK